MPLDRRLHAFRPDLADIRLAGQVEASRFTKGEPAEITVPVADLRAMPDLSAGCDTQLLFGERVVVFDRADGWAWVQAEQDSYVGYLPETHIAAIGAAWTHWVIQPRTFVYHEPDMKRPVLSALSMGSRLSVSGQSETRGTAYLHLATGGAVISAHCLARDGTLESDFVSVAARLIETPYLWGGKSAFGLDCSALVQLSLLMTGQYAPRDSDMQAATLGHIISGADLKRGDLVFWKGHVGIMEDAVTLLHANGHTMSVTREPLFTAIERIRPHYGEPTGYRRP
ncbi:MAG: hypothetical protein RIR97_980 [Pseudomonadota bacterium]